MHTWEFLETVERLNRAITLKHDKCFSSSCAERIDYDDVMRVYSDLFMLFG